MCTLLLLAQLIVIARVVLSWIPVAPGSGFASVASMIYSITEPVFGPLRRVLPPVRLGAGALDLSPIVVLLGIQILSSAVC